MAHARTARVLERLEIPLCALESIVAVGLLGGTRREGIAGFDPGLRPREHCREISLVWTIGLVDIADANIGVIRA